jgi:hypothetical protein
VALCPRANGKPTCATASRRRRAAERVPFRLFSLVTAWPDEERNVRTRDLPLSGQMRAQWPSALHPSHRRQTQSGERPIGGRSLRIASLGRRLCALDVFVSDSRKAPSALLRGRGRGRKIMALHGVSLRIDAGRPGAAEAIRACKPTRSSNNRKERFLAARTLCPPAWNPRQPEELEGRSTR